MKKHEIPSRIFVVFLIHFVDGIFLPFFIEQLQIFLMFVHVRAIAYTTHSFGHAHCSPSNHLILVEQCYTFLTPFLNFGFWIRPQICVVGAPPCFF